MDAFNSVHAVLNGTYRMGRYHADCPMCNKETKRNQTHFGYWETGYKCFVCGCGGGIKKLAKKLCGSETIYIVPTKKKATNQDRIRESIYPQVFNPSTPNQHCVEQWQRYKPLTIESIHRYGLWYGRLPTPTGTHKTNRLNVPLTYNGKIWGQKGRLPMDHVSDDRFSADKWIFSPTSLVRLWGMDHLPKNPDEVWVTENYVDAMLLCQFGIPAISTGGVDMLSKSAVAKLRGLNTRSVVLAYDNDLAGCGNAETVEMLNDELIKQGKPKRYPKGPEIAATLCSMGLYTTCKEWPNGTPPKADIGTLLIN